MKYLKVTLLLFSFFLLTNTSNAQVSVGGQDTLNVDAGETVTIPFVVNRSGSFKSKVQTPDQLSTVLNTENIQVEESKTEPVMLRVDNSALNDIYEVKYTITDENGNSYSASVYVSVEKDYDVSARLTRKSLIVQKREIGSELTLRNNSNVPVSLSLSATESFGKTIVSSKNVNLDVGEVRTIKLKTKDIQKTRSSRNHSLHVEVKNSETGEVLNKVSTDSYVATSTGNDKLSYHEYPVETGVNSFYQEGRQNRNGFYNQVYVKGNGKLVENSDTDYSFKLMSPILKNSESFSSNPFTIFSVWDRYSFRAKNNNLDIKLGDQNYQASELTGKNAYGFGSGFNYQNGLEVGGFYSNSRRSYQDRWQTGANIGYHFNKNYFLGTNIGKFDSPYIDASAVSIESDISPTDYIDFYGEFSRDESEGNVGNSYYVESKIGTSNYYIKGRLKDYSIQNPSWDRGSELYSTFGSARFGEFNINSSYRIYRNELYDNFENEKFKFRLGYDFLSTFYKFEERSWTNSINDLGSHSIGGSFRTDINFLTYNAEAELSWFNYPDGWKRQERYRSSLSFRKGQFSSRIGGYYITGVREFSRHNQNRVGIDGNLSYRWNSNRIGVNTSSQYYENSYSRWNNYYRAFYSKEFSNGFKIRTDGIYRNTFEKEWGVKLSVSKQFNIPIHKSKKTGMVHGNIMNQNGKPLNEIPILVNEKVGVSNENGKYYISELKPGTYDIKIISDKINNLVNGTQNPVVVNGAQKTKRNIKIVSAASLHGKVQHEDGDPAKNVIVEITNGNTSYRRISGNNGEMDFTGLKPGNWEVKLVKELTELKTVEKPDEFELEAGESDNFTLTVKEDEQITFIESPDESQIKQKPESEEDREIIGYTKYTVKKGDWLSKIADQKYGDPMDWVIIYNENMEKIDDPDLIYPGQVFVIPVFEKQN